jgi:branched-chain amino acid transport system substrate-binding protein
MTRRWKTNRRRAFGVAAGIAAVALVLAGCGSSSKSSPEGVSASNSVSESGNSSASSTVPAASGSAAAGEPIKIGLAIAATGYDSEAIAPSGAVATAWASWVNANGGIGGRPVQIDVQDTEGSAVNGLTIVKTFVADKDVAVILQDPSSEGVVGQYLDSEGMPVIGAEGYATNVWSALPNYFSVTTTADAIQQSTVASAKAAGASSIAVVSCAEIAVCAASGPMVSAEAAKLGISYDGQLLVSASAPNYTAECLSLIQKDVGAVFVNVTSDVAERFVAECTQQGYKGTYVESGGSVFQTALDGTKGAKYVGIVNAFPWWVNAAPVSQYLSVMAKYAPKVDVRNTFPSSMWVTLQLFRQAVENNTKGLTAAKVMADYDALKNVTLGGLLPQPLTFTAGQPAPKVPCYWMYSYTGGANNFKSIQQGVSGNSATGGLSSSCLPG